MNLLTAWGYRVTVTASDSAHFPTSLTATINIPRDLHLRVMQSQCAPHEQGAIPGSRGWPSQLQPTATVNGTDVARLILQYESNQDRGRRVSGLFNPMRIMVGIRTDLRPMRPQSGEPRMTRRHFDGFITNGGKGMFIASANGTQIEHRERPLPLCDAEPVLIPPQRPSALEGVNMLSGFGYTVTIATVEAGEYHPSAATATLMVPRWQVLQQLYTDMPTINGWAG